MSKGIGSSNLPPSAIRDIRVFRSQDYGYVTFLMIILLLVIR